METLRGRQYSFEQLTQLTVLNKVLDPLASSINDLLRRATVFLHAVERGSSAQSLGFSPMKTLSSWQWYFQNLIDFPMLTKVLDPLASDINNSRTTARVLLPFTGIG
jgi:hypothetical protein